MKRKKLLSAFDGVEDKYLAEADPSVKRKTVIHVLSAVIAASICLVTVLNLWLFLPYGSKAPNVSKYADSEYFEVIEKISVYEQNRKRGGYKNNFDKIWSNISDINFAFLLGFISMDGAGAAGDAGSENAGGEYMEITDNQTEGVIEGDRIKRSDTHIYYLSGSVLSVYAIRGEESEKVGAFDLVSVPALSNAKSYQSEWEFFLSKDCTTVTVIAPCFDYDAKNACVSVVTLNAENPEEITLKDVFSVSGGYLSSRKTESGLLLFTRFHMYGEVDFDKPETYLPAIDRGNGTEYLPADKIFSPDTLSALSYTVVLRLDEEGSTFVDASAFLSYSDEIYVSSENVYAMRSFREIEEQGGYRISKRKTEISLLSFADGSFTHKGSFTVDGEVKDRYSLDEYEGILRVVTTLNESILSVREEGRDNALSGDIAVSNSGTNASLYLIDLSDLSVVNKAERFAPDGESVQSVRFDKEMAYVCTSIVLKDPVFFFDLSDTANITYKETGTIEGFSTSLINLKDGYLLGIGVGDFDSVKLEVYKESESGVISISAIEVQDADYSEVYKAYYVDRENNLVGLGIREYRTGEDYYAVFHFDGYELRRVLKLAVTGNNDNKRGVYIDGCFYAFGDNGLKAESLVK